MFDRNAAGRRMQLCCFVPSSQKVKFKNSNQFASMLIEERYQQSSSAIYIVYFQLQGKKKQINNTTSFYLNIF